MKKLILCVDKNRDSRETSVKWLRKSGIYLISSAIDDRCYVGGAAILYSRFKDHRGSLLRNNHGNARLQNFFNKYGKNSLIFSVLEFCEKDKLVEREQFFIDELKPWFNILQKARSPLGRTYSPEVKAKISVAIRNSQKHKEAAKRNGLLRRGFKHTSKAKLKMSRAAKKRRWSEEHKRKISESLKGRPSPTKGRVLSDEHKEKLRRASLGRKHTEEAKEKIRLSHLGKEFTASHRLNLSKSCIGRVPWNRGISGSKLSKEHRLKISQGLKKHYQTSEGEARKFRASLFFSQNNPKKTNVF